MDQKWLTTKIEHEGYPLYLRKPDYLDIFVHRHDFPNILRVTQKLKEVKSNGLPESNYNMSLMDFDEQMCKLYGRDEGLIFLIETYAGKRNYYYFISKSTDYKQRIQRIEKDYPDIEIDADLYADKEWKFLKHYPKKLY